VSINIGFKFLCLMSLWCFAFGYLKVENIVDWSWVIVLAPMWLPFALPFALQFIMFCAVVLMALFVFVCEKIGEMRR